jgi:hypothetical protein
MSHVFMRQSVWPETFCKSDQKVPKITRNWTLRKNILRLDWSTYLKIKYLIFASYDPKCSPKTFNRRKKFSQPANFRPIWDRCYDFKNIFAEKFSKKLAFLTQNKATFWNKLFICNIGIFFRRKLGKIAENCDHNIDSWSHWRQSEKTFDILLVLRHSTNLVTLLQNNVMVNVMISPAFNRPKIGHLYILKGFANYYTDNLNML